MTEVTVGSLFTGAGALCELAVAPLLGGRVVWHCEFEPPTEKNPRPRQAAARLLEHRFPGTPNLGDISAVDWSRVEPVRVLTGGFPCTDVSLAGQQAGLRPGTRSGLCPAADTAGDRPEGSRATRGRRPGLADGGVAAVQLLPTPRATDGVKGGPNQRGSSGDLMLPSVVAKLLPTPASADARGTRNRTANRRAPLPTTATTGSTLSDAIWDMSVDPVDWSVYELAVRRHERWLGRPVPFPTIEGARGARKLNPQLSEWMMGWPAGWVTEVPGLTPNDALQVCGNGVVPQQIIAAIWYLLPHLFTEGRWAA